MARGDLSERMARHLDSSETTLVRQEKAVARHEGILGRHVEVLNRQDGRSGDLRDFLDQKFEFLGQKFEGLGQKFEGLDRRFDGLDQQFEDLRTVLREASLRNEKILRELIDHIAEFSATQAKRTDEVIAELRDGREEARAQRQALLALIDRLPPPADAT